LRRHVRHRRLLLLWWGSRRQRRPRRLRRRRRLAAAGPLAAPWCCWWLVGDEFRGCRRQRRRLRPRLGLLLLLRLLLRTCVVSTRPWVLRGRGWRVRHGPGQPPPRVRCHARGSCAGSQLHLRAVW
jgi:hypothetical protein